MSEHSDLLRRSPADWALLVVGFLVFWGIFYWLTPTILYAEKSQPFTFSHKMHVKQVDGMCEECHAFRDDGTYVGIPSIEKCQDCHEEQPLGKSPEEKIFVEQYLVPKKPIPWKVYAKQPDCVYFSHAPHLKGAKAKETKLECATCHADHGETEKLRPYVYNRITGYSRDIYGYSIIPFGPPDKRMKMDTCADCHRENGIRDACFVCHK